MKATVFGAGLAGCEAAYQLLKRGVEVTLVEMKPRKKSPAHCMDGFAELVCSNSLKSDSLTGASGVLKAELRRLDSLLIRCADKTSVPAGGALAVDRYAFSDCVTAELKKFGNLKIEYRVAEKISEGVNIIATGPLTDELFLKQIKELCGKEFLYFFDAAAPIVTAESVDAEKSFVSSRYDKGTADYVNCPLTREEFEEFYRELVNAETVKLRDFENSAVFEGCMPIEVMAARGVDTIRFGPMKPVGLSDPATGKRPYAVLQLRKENAEGTLLNLVGFQTHLTFGEQKRVFSLIPALKNAEFVRYGVMHKNIFINSPALLDSSFSLKSRPEVFFAGQISGVEGYVESIASGLMCGVNAFRMLTGKPPVPPDGATMCGALALHVSRPNENFQPMNSSFGILKPLEQEIRDKVKKKKAYADRALAHTDKLLPEVLNG